MTVKPLKLLFIGAGGVGGYYAARLTSAGHHVVVTARGPHLDAIQRHGLEVIHEGQKLHCTPPAVDHDSLKSTYAADDFDLVIVTVKSTATQTMMEDLGPWMVEGTVPILSLQNGVDNEPAIAEVVSENRVLGGLAVRIGGHIQEPGKVTAEGLAQVVMGEWPQQSSDRSAASSLLEVLESCFNAAGIPTRLSDNIRHELWRKLVINNGVNPLSALTGLDTRSLTHHQDYGKVVYRMMSETVIASSADGVNLTRDDLDEMFELISSFNAIKTSMLVDKEKGRPLELDSISGAVLRRCDILGTEAPYTFLVNALLRG
jgi:2-dehydropantoate 2-reductase